MPSSKVVRTLAIAIALSFAFSGAASAQTCLTDPGPKYRPISDLDNGGYPICYQEPIETNKAAYVALQGRHLLETYSQFLAPLRLPHPLNLVARNCVRDVGTDSPFYDPGDRSLNFCYEWVDAVRHAAALRAADGSTPASIIAGMWAGTLLHETGHAMFDMLDVPVFGREEDAADEVAAFIALQFSKEVEVAVIKGFAHFWETEAKALSDPTTAMNPAYSDEHGTASQRLYNTLCLAYGGDPVTFGEFVNKGWLPAGRAANCGREYRQLAFAFSKTILPFIDPQARMKVQALQWMLPEDFK